MIRATGASATPGDAAIALALYIASFHSLFAHANDDVRMGWPGYIMMGPEHHRFHHSTEQHEAMNFGALTAPWDRYSALGQVASYEGTGFTSSATSHAGRWFG